MLVFDLLFFVIRSLLFTRKSVIDAFSLFMVSLFKSPRLYILELSVCAASRVRVIACASIAKIVSIYGLFF